MKGDPGESLWSDDAFEAKSATGGEYATEDHVVLDALLMQRVRLQARI